MAILTSAVIQEVLALNPEQSTNRISYTASAEHALKMVTSGQAQIAFLVVASTVDDLMTIAAVGDKMPPKSTYFWPKVPTGLVIHDLC
ncbi:MAG: hypothetical protein ACJ789_09855 [Thermomicrobiales bacterium]